MGMEGACLPRGQWEKKRGWRLPHRIRLVIQPEPIQTPFAIDRCAGARGGGDGRCERGGSGGATGDDKAAARRQRPNPQPQPKLKADFVRLFHFSLSL